MTEDQKSIAERAEYHKGNLKDLTKDEIVHFLPAVLANKDAVIAELRAELAKSQPVEPPFPEADLTGVQVCCGDYFQCGRPCTPRGRALALRELESVEQGKPVRTMSDEPRYTVDQIADAACHAEVNDSKFESMCVYLGGIKGATA